jgi:hypothetical protein
MRQRDGLSQKFYKGGLQQMWKLDGFLFLKTGRDGGKQY